VFSVSCLELQAMRCFEIQYYIIVQVCRSLEIRTEFTPRITELFLIVMGLFTAAAQYGDNSLTWKIFRFLRCVTQATTRSLTAVILDYADGWKKYSRDRKFIGR
jgi:hypothetical protein